MYKNLTRLQEWRYKAPAKNALSTEEGDPHSTDIELSIHHLALMRGEPNNEDFPHDAEGRTLYGLALWPAALALAEILIERRASLPGKAVLELGAGAGLPGILASVLGASVTQVEARPEVLALCRRNGERNGQAGIRYSLFGWGSEQPDDKSAERLSSPLPGAPFDLILGGDILYRWEEHDALREALEQNLAADGCVLFADPMRPASYGFLEAMERHGWRVRLETRHLALPGGEPAAAEVGIATLSR